MRINRTLVKRISLTTVSTKSTINIEVMETQSIDGSIGIQLKKKLSLSDGVALILGSIIGNGIFISPKGVLQGTGSVGLALIVWELAGLISVLGGLCYAELGTMIPKSGGDYSYINEAFGRFPSFVLLWTSFFALCPSVLAILALSFSKTILQPFWPSCYPPSAAIHIIAALTSCSLTAIHCYNVRLVTMVQKIFVATKVLVLVVIIFMGFYMLGTGDLGYLKNPMVGTTSDPGLIADAFFQAFYAYSGWQNLNFVTEELKDPTKNIPRAITIALSLVIVIYALTNVAYFVVLGKGDLLASEAIVVTFGEKVLGVMSWTMPFFVACSLFGSLNASTFLNSRISFVGARDGLLPLGIALINVDRFTPVPSLVIQCIICQVFLFTTDVHELITDLTLTTSLFRLMSVSGLLWLRYHRPDLHRPIKVNLFVPVIFIVIDLLLVVLLSLSRPVEVAISVAIMIGCIPLYLIFIRWTNKPAFFVSLAESFNMLCARVFMSVLPEKKE